MKCLIRIFCLLFAVILLFSACETKSDPSGGTTTTTKGKETTTMDNNHVNPIISENPIPLTNLIITRSTTADSLIVSAANALKRAIEENAASGISPDVKGDSVSRNVPEILIGDTNRAETTEAKALLGGEANAFAIRRFDKKLAVVGTTDEMTCYGVEYLIREIVPTYVLDDSVGLAEDYQYIGTCGTLALATNGKASFRVSACASSDVMSGALMQNVETVRKAFQTVTGSSAIYYPDNGSSTATRDATVKEILVGSTYHPETYRVFSQLTYSEGVVAIEGNKIIVFGFTEAALEAAADLFCNLLSSHTSGKNIVLPEKLFLRVNDKAVKMNAPVYPSAIQKLVPVDGDGMMVYLPKTNSTEFDAYASDLEEKGYVSYAQNTLGNSKFYTYTKDRVVINGGFDPTDSVARVILEYPGAKLPASETFDAAVDSVCEPLLTQVDLNNLNCQSGMSYVVRLRDGRFLVIDGGATDYDEAKHLYDLLKEQNVLGGKPTIAAWFLTHAHGDHYQAFLEMAQNYTSNVTIQSVVINLATPGLFSVNFDTATKAGIYSKVKGISGVKIVYARTGQQFRFANATIDVWLTPEDLYIGASNIDSGNDASVIYRMTCEGQTTMFLADAEQGIAGTMIRRYGNAMKSDIMQISHHGYNYNYIANMSDLFQLIDPNVVLWPSVDHWYHYFTDPNNTTDYWTGHQNRNLIDSVKAKNGEIVPACHGTRVLTLPYAAQPMAEYYYTNGDVIYSQNFESIKNIYELGWQMSDSLTESYTTPVLSLTTINGDKGLLMTGGDCSTLSFLCRDHLKNITAYTVTMDINVQSLGNGFWLWYHDSEPMKEGGRALYEITQTGTFTLKLVINRGTGGTTRAYINGSEIGTYTNASNDLGPLIFLLKNAKVFVGKVEVVAGIN